MKAFLKNYRQAPRKVRLICDLVRGKNVAVAVAELGEMPHKGARAMKKLIESAAANARQENSTLTDELLVVKTVTADKGMTYTRYMPRAFGRATPINRECSHIRVELAPVGDIPAVATTDKTEKEASKPEDKSATKEEEPKSKDEKKEDSEAKKEKKEENKEKEAEPATK